MSKDFYQDLIDNILDGIYFVDRQKIITFWSKGAERITGYTKDEVMGSCCADNILKHIDEQGHELCLLGCPLSQTLIDCKIREVDVYLHHKEGHRVPVSVRISPILDDRGHLIGAVEVFSDNSQNLSTRQELEKLRQEVFLDALTQVGNRKFAYFKLENSLKQLVTYNIPFGLLFLDIDYFKNFNDTYGHLVGDRILIMVAKTISNVLRGLDVVCRWGGEEFLIIVNNVDLEVLARIGTRVRACIEKSWFTLEGEIISVTVSIGGTTARKEDSVESLINRADRQMYKSKDLGRNCLTLDS